MKGERYAVYLRVLRIEQAQAIYGVGHSPETSAYHLLAQELGAEGPNS